MADQLYCFKSEIEIIVREASQFPDLETGGDLFGYWSHSGSPVVHYAIGPGRTARHNQTSFYQDAEFLEREGARLNDEFGLQHIGEWHSHHQLGLARPSSGDVNTVQRSLARYGFPRFVLLICNLSRSSRHSANDISVGAFSFDVAATRPYTESPWVVFPRVSPIREALGTRLSHAAPLPKYELRPRELSMRELRLPQKTYSPVETVATGWFTTDGGRLRLRREHQEFKQNGMESKMIVTDDSRIVVTVPSEDYVVDYRLPEDFPEQSPEVSLRRTSQPATLIQVDQVCGRAWGPTMYLVDIHRGILLSRSTDPQPPAKFPEGDVEAGAGSHSSEQDGSHGQKQRTKKLLGFFL